MLLNPAALSGPPFPRQARQAYTSAEIIGGGTVAAHAGADPPVKLDNPVELPQVALTQLAQRDFLLLLGRTLGHVALQQEAQPAGILFGLVQHALLDGFLNLL